MILKFKKQNENQPFSPWGPRFARALRGGERLTAVWRVKLRRSLPPFLSSTENRGAIQQSLFLIFTRLP